MSDNLVDLSLNLKNSQSAQLPPAKRLTASEWGNRYYEDKFVRQLTFK